MDAGRDNGAAPGGVRASSGMVVSFDGPAAGGVEFVELRAGGGELVVARNDAERLGRRRRVRVPVALSRDVPRLRSAIILREVLSR
jgi:hypothetical protein